MTDINGTYSCCNTINIFGEETEGEGGGGLTPGQEQDLNDVVEKTQLQSFVSPTTTDFIGNLTVNGLPVGGGAPFDQSLNTSDDVQFEQLTVKDSTGVNPDNTTLKNDRIEFRGDPINTSLGSITYQDGAVYKVISMGVDKGDFPSASQARIVVDGNTYLFQDSGLNMNSKKIVNLTNPLAAQDAATKSYVDQEISNIPPTDLSDLENKTQNISDLTVANNTKYSGAQNFYMGSLGSADVFSINYGVPSDTLVSRIFDTAGGTVNTTATLNTTNIIPSVADTWDIGNSTNRYNNVYLRNLFTEGLQISSASINGLSSGFSLGYQGIANVIVNPTETAFEKDVNITNGNLGVVSGNVNVPSGTLFIAGSNVPLNVIWDNSVPDATYTNARKTLNIDTNIATYRAFVSTNSIFKYTSNGSFSLKTSAGSSSPVYVGFIKGPPPSSGVAGFYGQLNGGAFIENGVGIGGDNAWTTNTTLTFTIQNGQWKIESTEFVGGTFRPLINDISDYYICVICDANGLSNPLSIEITSSTFSGLSPQAIIADGNVNVINGNINCGNQVIATPTSRGTFDASNDATFYSDEYVSIKWSGAGKQPQFSVNSNYVGYWDVSYEVIKNDDAIYANQDILTSVNNDYFFTGGTVINTTYSAVNFSTRFNCFLHKESGSTAPSYDIVVKSGNVNQFAAYMVNIIKPDSLNFGTVGTERTIPSPAPVLRVSNKSRIIQMEGQILSLLNRFNSLTHHC